MDIDSKLLKQLYTPLANTHCRLEPLGLSDKNDLYAAAQHPDIWTHTISSALGDGFEDWFRGVLDAQHAQTKLPFVVKDSSHKIVGFTRYLDINFEHKRLEIGSTWYHPDVWGTAINPSCKFLLLSHAFDSCGFNRVAFLTDSLNQHSKAAIQKLGAIREGVLRSHMIVQDGRLRDSVVYSITCHDWKTSVKDRLHNRILEFNT